MVGCVSLAMLSVSHDKNIKLINGTTQFVYLVSLSLISGVLAFKISKRLKLHNMSEIKKNLVILEFFIQMIIYVRLITSMAELSSASAKQNPAVIITIMCLSFTMSELVPLSLVVYGVYLQIDWRKLHSAVNNVPGINRGCSDLTESLRDEAQSRLDDEIEKSLKIHPDDLMARVSFESRHVSSQESDEEDTQSKEEFTFLT